MAQGGRESLASVVMPHGIRYHVKDSRPPRLAAGRMMAWPPKSPSPRSWNTIQDWGRFAAFTPSPTPAALADHCSGVLNGKQGISACAAGRGNIRQKGSSRSFMMCCERLDKAAWRSFLFQFRSVREKHYCRTTSIFGSLLPGCPALRTFKKNRLASVWKMRWKL